MYLIKLIAFSLKVNIKINIFEQSVIESIPKEHG